ncbi:MAG: cation:proton antiporter [Myxococcota bacterium]
MSDATESLAPADPHGHDEHEYDDGHGPPSASDSIRQLVIVSFLIGGLLLLHAFGSPEAHEGNYDPTAMLALGFVILASFTIGQLVGVIRLPHITGYLLAGMVFGPSISGFVPYRLFPPFDEGVLNDRVIGQLRPLETLAVALIALTAGGELRIEGLKKGLKAIFGVLGAQLVFVLVATTAYVWAIGGTYPDFALPGFEGVEGRALIYVGLTVAAISFATSPAATIAVINEGGAKGPMSRTVLSAVVLKDVLVVVLFGVFSALALTELGGTSEVPLEQKLAWEIFGSLVVGVVLGGGMALYLRYVGKELLLFIVGVVYAATFVVGWARTTELHAELDPVLIFLTTGFTVANFSRHGETFIHSVEKIAMPVYVVFFTLAGAKLHLDEVIHLFSFAIGLVAVRVAAIYLGVRLGAALGDADEGTKKYGWMGFVSQAGVAITFAGFVSMRFGEPGEALGALLIAGVAINEVIGPVLLKVGLGLAGELKGPATEAPEEEAPLSEVAPPKPSPWSPWAEDEGTVDWGPPLRTGEVALDRTVRDLENDLRVISRTVSEGPVAAFRKNAEDYLRELRREFLRHHRRLLVAARQAGEIEDEEARMSARRELAAALRAEQAELAEKWRGALLRRRAELEKSDGWSPNEVVQSLDEVSEQVPERMALPYDEGCFVTKPSDGVGKRVQRGWLRLRRGTSRFIGQPMARRDVALRDLVRFHLSGATPPNLEAVAALFIEAERHLAGRTRNLFDGLVNRYDALASRCLDPDLDMHAEVAAMRGDVEEELLLALDEVGRMGRDAIKRTARVLAKGVRDVKAELPTYCSVDLPERRRRPSRIFKERVAALKALTEHLGALRKSVAGEVALVAMELELVGLEARVKDLVASYGGRLKREMGRRATVQAERAAQAFAEARQHVDAELSSSDTGHEMAGALRQITEVTEKTAGEAARVVGDLQTELLDEEKLAPLMHALSEAASALTPRYRVIAGRLMRGAQRLPPAVQRVDVPFRDLVLEHGETRIGPELFRASRETSEKLQPLVAALREAERLVAFNVELATVELEVTLGETVPKETRALIREMVVGQLDRSEARVDRLADQAAGLGEALDAGIHEATLGALDELRAQLVDGDVTRAKLEELRREASRRRFLQRAVRFPSALSEARVQLGRAVGALVGDARLEMWRRRLGLKIREDIAVLGPQTFAAPKPLAELPNVYRRLFSADTMEAADVLTGREEQIRHARNVLGGEAKKERGKGRLRAVALVGLDGVGKASVAAAIVRGGRWKTVKKFAFERPARMDDVERVLREAQDASLVVVDGLHWLTAARPGGYDPLRRFVDGVVKTAGKKSWLVQAEELWWRYASSVASLDDAFPEVVRLEPLSPDELRAAVMERHRLSGYGHAFGRSRGRGFVEQLVARGASRVRAPFQQYFNDLHAASGGLVRDALRLWLASIDAIETDSVVHVGHVPASGYTALGRLPRETLIVLYQVARQGWMDAAVLAHLFRIDEDAARAHLARLRHLGVLTQKDSAYRVSVHLRGALVRVLDERGWA